MNATVTTTNASALDCPCGARKALHIGHSNTCTRIERPSDAYHGHIITVPAHLVPFIMDDLDIDDIHDATDGRKRVMTLSGYDFNYDGAVSTLRWQTWNGTMTVIPTAVDDDTTLTLWVPSIPEALAAELA